MIRNHKSTLLRRTIWISALVLGTLLLVTAGYLGHLYYKADSAIERMAAPSDAMQEKDDQSHELVTNEKAIRPFLMLLAGIDNREGSGGTLNTDVLMFISYNPETRSASMMSLPRDLLMKPKDLPNRKANFYYAYYAIKDKDAAIANTKRFYRDMLGLPIDYMALVNFDALRQIVDTVGGLEIDVDMDMKYVDTADGTHIDLKKGLQKLDGQKTLDFVRYRKSNRGSQESSDFARGERQQQVIKQLTDKLSAFQGMAQWGKVLDIIGDNVKTDMPANELKQWLFNFPTYYPKMIRSLHVEADWKSPYVYAKEEDMRQALADLRAEVGDKEDSPIRLGDVMGLMK
ncbi:LCP family protein [Paenibacillus terrigena]|uniref:LCP family protein n=1 Tax=Paenibacillus terrigena TaxID=369333 RepID=UPI0028D18BE1|nr:LCP family protein [Paenibacillus terrigena]